MLYTIWRNLPDLLFWGIALVLHGAMYWSICGNWMPQAPKLRAAVAGALILSAIWISLSVVFSLHHFADFLPAGDLLRWMRGIGLLWGLLTIGTFAAILLIAKLSPVQHFRPERRVFLQAAQGAVLASPAIITGYGVFAARNQFELKEIEIPVPGLAKDLHGLRLVQISDIHMSPFLTRPELRRVVDMANETRAHVALVTGDLITGPHDPLEDCITELARLKTDAGVLGCMGNHEIFGDCEDFTKLRAGELGMNFLRQEHQVLRFGQAHVNFAGVDYQRFTMPYLVDAEKLVEPGMVNILLSHNPDVFETAARKGFDVTLAGHTHGGQVTVEILNQYVNVARFFTKYVYGRYSLGNSSIYVTRGIGTVGIPARLGATPEVSLIRLVQG